MRETDKVNKSLQRTKWPGIIDETKTLTGLAASYTFNDLTTNKNLDARPGRKRQN
jgi:hypothetical protein